VPTANPDAFPTIRPVEIRGGMGTPSPLCPSAWPPTRMNRVRMRLSPVGPEFSPGTDGLATVDRDDLHLLQAEAIR
jgi:hypothetical protein